MACELMLLRHGKSDWSFGLGDMDRPLAKRGKRDSKTVGKWLINQGLVPDLVISSPAKRARSTARRVAENMDFSKGNIQFDDRIYAADVTDLLRVIKDIPESAGRVMLVGHNPGFEDLVEYLADAEVETPDDGKLVPTATVARLTMKGSWESAGASCARLESITRPYDIPGED